MKLITYPILKIIRAVRRFYYYSKETYVSAETVKKYKFLDE